MPEMISLEEARALVLSHAAPLPVETVPVLEAVGRVAAADLKSDIDISPFAHSAMDGFAVRAAELAERRRKRRSNWTSWPRSRRATCLKALSRPGSACAS